MSSGVGAPFGASSVGVWKRTLPAERRAEGWIAVATAHDRGYASARA